MVGRGMAVEKLTSAYLLQSGETEGESLVCQWGGLV